MAKLEKRITVDPEQCGGRPCVRGMRIRVTDVLDLLAVGLTPDQVLRDLPDLESEDIQACLRFARGLSRWLLNLAERGGRASYPQFTAVRGIPT